MLASLMSAATQNWSLSWPAQGHYPQQQRNTQPAGSSFAEGKRLSLSHTASSLQPCAACWTPCVFSIFDHCLYLTSDLGVGMKYNSCQWLLAIPCYIWLLWGHCKTLDGLLVKIIGFLFGQHSEFSTSSPKLSKALSWSSIKPQCSEFKA